MSESKVAKVSSDEKPSQGKAPQAKYDSHDLFRGGPEVLIEHAEHIYRLRITRQGKLILTK